MGPACGRPIRLLAASMVYYGHAWLGFMGQYVQRRFFSILLTGDGIRGVKDILKDIAKKHRNPFLCNIESPCTLTQIFIHLTCIIRRLLLYIYSLERVTT